MTEPASPAPHPRYLPDDSVDAPAPGAPTASRWEDFIDIFYVPSSVFRRRERSGFGLPLLVVSLLIGGIFLAQSGAMQPIMDAEFERGMAVAMRNNPQLTPEMMQSSRAIGETVMKPMAIIGTPIAMVITGIFLWLCGKIVGARQTVGAALTVAAYAYVPKVLEMVLSAVQLLVVDPATLNGRFRLSLGIGRFLDPDTVSPVVVGLLGRVDLFTIWVTVLLAIGLAVTGKVSRGKAAIAVTVLWLLGAVPALLQAARS
ncbi:MAG: YIP1 family protein [Gemmatimonadaceae bacterium]|nr:YIP1 family protein [Gemmatimonadaceae bacterium]